MVIALAYLAILAIGAVGVGARQGPILLRGGTLLWFNGIAFGLQVLLRPFPALVWLPLFAIIFGVSWLGRNTWVIFKGDPASLSNAVETRLRRVLVEFSRDRNGYEIHFGGRLASIRLQRLFPGIQALTFGGNWQENRAKLARRFLGKYFEPVIPRPRFRV
jgi:hypothetical protein